MNGIKYFMQEDRKLHVLWTNSNVNTSRMMVMMYVRNAMLHRLWDNITVIIWGDTARLVATDAIIQEEILLAKQAGVHFSACIACAINLGVREDLEALGIEVISWGIPLTQLLQEDKKILTI